MLLVFTFKENCPDIRNSKIINIIEEVRSYRIESLVTDTMADDKGSFRYLRRKI